MNKKKIKERTTGKSILKKTKNVNGCFLWQGAVDKDGYPKSTYRFSDGSYEYRTHRALMRKLGYDTTGKTVVSSCGNVLCLNPDHISLGTQQQAIKNRSKRGNTIKGSKMFNTFLTEDDILEMAEDRARGFTYKELAAMYGYSTASAAHQALHKYWKHVNKDDFLT